MPRTAQKPAPIAVEPGPLPSEHALTLAEEQEIKQTESDMAFEAARAIGRLEAFQFSRDIAEFSQVQIFLELKKNKAYRALSIKDASGNARRVAHLEEFCESFLGKSARRMQELASNYHLLGADLYESAERIGFRQKDYTALKALPADDQEVIRQAIATDSRDQVLDLLQEMAARHASEKAALTAKATEAEETATARDQVVRAKESKISQLEEDLHKARHRLQLATPDEVGKQLSQETAGIGWSVVGLINDDLAKGFAALDEHARLNDCTHEEFMSGVLFEIERAVGAIREAYAVKARPDGDPRPDWTREDFDSTPSQDTIDAMTRFEKEHGYNPMNQAANG